MNPSLANMNRTKLLFFAGVVEGINFDSEFPSFDAGYSGGVRQTVMRMYGNDPRFDLHNSTKIPGYYERMASSIFCLAPSGLGWGARV
jgi:hypothetical protein